MSDLGAAVRAWRDRLDPVAVGLPHRSPRRVPGLRRAELAMLAGISVDYVVQLEQGRAPTPSAQVCAALARALQLAPEELAHLLRLAGHAEEPGHLPRLIPDSLHRIMTQLTGHPLAVCDAAWQLLHWNPLYAATFGDPTRLSAAQRNVLIWHFEQGPTRVRQDAAERAAFEVELVGDLRATTSRYPGDPAVAALVARLQRSARFRELWDRQAVTEHRSSGKIVEHPEAGEIALDCDILSTQASSLRLVVYTPRPGTDARSKLDLLMVLGTQRITTGGAQP
ncbi:helix-turn-helix domain-containing protein [Actinoplanes sp. N902-109]|uniref:helix-turn-helix domain-containing protein n=1 Tax=Actinoplanes sp. (strain N902-109) TaxID=649831 RepID=UPI0018DD88AD|nr:helix-turn-helix domain-containing protein [Actinoplanes sp. N902-109]